VASRRKAADLIRGGRVQVDGRVVVNPGTQVDPGRARVEVDGRAVCPEPHIYILLNKPRGPLSTAMDHRGRQTVLDLIGDMAARLYPAGRLDADTEGLLLITNDGELTYRLTHPRFEVEKVYEAQVKGRPSPAALQRLAEGVMLEDGPSGPAKVRLLAARSTSPFRTPRVLQGPRGSGSPAGASVGHPEGSRGAAGESTSVVELTIHSGRKRQVRRTLKAVGHPVVTLRRTRVGPLRLQGLRPGEWRLLRGEEVSALRRYIARASQRSAASQSSKRRSARMRRCAPLREGSPGGPPEGAPRAHRKRSWGIGSAGPKRGGRGP
jgi:pseudouridine synthase